MSPKRPRRTAAQRRDFRKLTDREEDSLAHGMGFLEDTNTHAFESDEDARRAWEIHGERIMGAWGVPFRRPRGWWRFGQDEPTPPTATAELVRLGELEALTAREKGSLVEHLTPCSARALVSSAALDGLPHGIRRAVLGHRHLLTGLSEKGVDAFLAGVPEALREDVGAAQEKAQ